MHTPASPSAAATAGSASLAFGRNRFAGCAAAALRAVDRLAPDLAARLAVDLFFTPLPSKLSSRRRPPRPWQAERHHTGHEAWVLLRLPPAPVNGTPRPRVLLVHGWAGDALQMLPLGQAAAAAGWEPVLMDLPAHGRSPGWRCTMPQIVRSLFHAEATAGPFDAVIAHSMGAVASLHALAAGLTARRLVALAPSSAPAAVLQWFGEAFGLSSALLGRMRRRIEGHEQMVLEQFEAAWLGRRVGAPVLLLHDQADRMAPLRNAEALAAALPSAQLQVTHGLSHRRILGDPQVIERALAHLRAGGGQGAT